MIIKLTHKALPDWLPDRVVRKVLASLVVAVVVTLGSAAFRGQEVRQAVGARGGSVNYSRLAPLLVLGQRRLVGEAPPAEQTDGAGHTSN